MSPLVSVIVPVYNAQQYLAACVDSILSQTYAHIEVMIVDDGSTDGSAALADRLASSNDRVKVMHQPNRGQAAARNAGIDRIQGDVVMFVDADDLMEQSCIQDCVRELERTGADIVEFRYRRIDADGESVDDGDMRGRFQRETVLGREDAVLDVVRGVLAPFVWSCAMRHDVLENPNKVRFPLGRFLDDEAVKYRMYANANKVALLPKVEYVYRWHPGSLMAEADRERTSLARAENVDERFRYFTDDPSDSGVVVSAALGDALLERDVEEMLAAYYGLLRQGCHRGDTQVASVRQRLCRMVDVCRNRQVHIGRGGGDADFGDALPYRWCDGNAGTHARPTIGNRQWRTHRSKVETDEEQ